MNGDAIYETRSCAPYREGRYAYTRKKDNQTIFVFALYDEVDTPVTEPKFSLPESFCPASVSTMAGIDIPFEVRDGRIALHLPQEYVFDPNVNVWKISRR